MCDLRKYVLAQMNLIIYIGNIIDSGSFFFFFFLPIISGFRAAYAAGCASYSFLVAPEWCAIPEIRHVLSLRFRSDVVFAASGTVLGCTFMSSSGFVGEPVWVALSGSWGHEHACVPRHGGLLCRAAGAAHPPTAVGGGAWQPPELPRGSL